MDKKKVAQTLEEIATLLELRGDNPFHCNAYRNAARALDMFEGDFGAVVAEGRLTEIKGIGKGLSATIGQLVAEGTTHELDALRAATPPGLLDMLRIPGFGPKKARAVHGALGVETLAALEAACRDGRVAQLKGFGEKSQEKVLAGIAQLKASAGRFRLDEARAVALLVLRALESHASVRRACAAGSLRRWKETVADIDLLVATDRPDAIMDLFVHWPRVEEVIAHGETKSSVRFAGGLQADLRCVADDQFPFALAYFTGSKEHNTAMRGRAKKRGLKLNEYGLFPEAGGNSIPCATEEDIFRALDLAYIPPELREDLGEIEAAERGSLPRLIEPNDICAILHIHTTASDGAVTAIDYAKWAAEHHRIRVMGIADHSRSAAYANGLSVEAVARQHETIDRVNAQWRDRGVTLLKGIESDILADGALDYDDDTLARFDFIVASVHSRFQMSREDMTRRICRAIEHPRTTILGHPTGRLLLKREGYELDMEAVLDCAARRGVAVEINANPFRLDLDWRFVRRAIDKGVLLAVNPDAHDLAGLDDMAYGIGVARKGWATAESVINAWPLERLRAWLDGRRAAAAR